MRGVNTGRNLGTGLKVLGASSLSQPRVFNTAPSFSLCNRCPPPHLAASRICRSGPWSVLLRQPGVADVSPNSQWLCNPCNVWSALWGSSPVLTNFAELVQSLTFLLPFSSTIWHISPPWLDPGVVTRRFAAADVAKSCHIHLYIVWLWVLFSEACVSIIRFVLGRERSIHGGVEFNLGSHSTMHSLRLQRVRVWKLMSCVNHSSYLAEALSYMPVHHGWRVPAVLAIFWQL